MRNKIRRLIKKHSRLQFVDGVWVCIIMPEELTDALLSLIARRLKG